MIMFNSLPSAKKELRENGEFTDSLKIEVSRDKDLEGNEVFDLYLNSYHVTSGRNIGGVVLASYSLTGTDLVKLRARVRELSKTYKIVGETEWLES